MLYGAVSTAIPCVVVLQEKDVKSVKTCVVQDISTAIPRVLVLHDVKMCVVRNSCSLCVGCAGHVRQLHQEPGNQSAAQRPAQPGRQDCHQ